MWNERSRKLVRDFERRLHKLISDELPSGSLSEEDFKVKVFDTLTENNLIGSNDKDEPQT